MPAEQLSDLEKVIESLTAQGYRVTTSLTEQTYAEKYAGWLPYEIKVHGTDHEGIIHQISQHLSQCGVNIESLDTWVTRAPMRVLLCST
jgi:glycine cleavage system transcriptional repressor